MRVWVVAYYDDEGHCEAATIRVFQSWENTVAYLRGQTKVSFKRGDWVVLVSEVDSCKDPTERSVSWREVHP